MKRLLCICLLLALSLTACGTTGTVSDPTTTATSTTAATKTAATTTEAKPLPTVPTGTGTYDLDLTTLSSTMVYAEVNNMMISPDNYAGKSIKMTGTCDVYHDEATGKTYYACIIKDATACCASGIEFELTGGDYPNKDDEVTVAGTFDTYEEGGATYAVLRNATRIA